MHRWLVYRREVMHTPLRTLADEIGISKSGLDQFYKQSSYPGKVWPKLREWYVRDLSRSHDRPLDTPEQLLDVVPALHALPFKELPEAMRETAAFLRELHEKRNVPAPAWIDSLYGWADHFEEQIRREET